MVTEADLVQQSRQRVADGKTRAKERRVRWVQGKNSRGRGDMDGLYNAGV